MSNQDIQQGLQVALQIGVKLAMAFGLPTALFGALAAMLGGCYQPSETNVISEPSAAVIVETVREAPPNNSFY